MPRTTRRHHLSVAAVVLLGAALLFALVAPASGQPLAPWGLQVSAVGEYSVNVTFRPSNSTGVRSYQIYISTQRSNDSRTLVALQGFDRPLYDTIDTTAPANISGMVPSLDTRFWFQNASRADWTLGYAPDAASFVKLVPSDFTALAYRITGLPANETVWIAVTATDSAGENTTINPVSAVPLAQAIPQKPNNSGIYLTWGLIIAAVIAAIALVARHEGRKNRAAYLYILPPLVGLAALTFYPVIFGFFISFTDRVGEQNPTFNLVGIANYLRVFEQPDLVMVATTTLVWTLVNVVLHVSIGLFLAVLLNRKLRGRVVYRALLLLPWAVPSYITTLAWRGMFETHQGLINQLIGPTGWQIFGCGTSACQWLTATNSWMPLFAVIVTNVWLGFPFMMMVFSGALQGIPPELYEAADVDGVSGWQKFRRITLPLLKPSIVPASLLGFIWTFNMFNVIYLMTAGRPPVPIPGMQAGATDILITYVYRVGFQPPFEQGFAAAYSVVIFFMLLGFGLFYTKYTGALEAFAGGKAGERRTKAEPRTFVGRFVGAVRAAWDHSVGNPIRAAMSPEQPERLQIHRGIAVALGVLGVLEVAYGVGVETTMPFWYIVTVVNGFWFMVVGFGLLLGAVGLAFWQRGGRRIGAWALVLEILGAMFAVLGSPLSLVNLRLPAAVLLLALLARPVEEYTGESDLWTRFTDRTATRREERRAGTIARKTAWRWLTIPIHVFLVFAVVVTILPILVVVGTAFGGFPAMGLQNTPIVRDILMPGQPLPGWTLDHFHAILFDSQFSTWLWNSVLVSGGTTAVGLLLATTGAYGFSRFNFRGKRASMLSFVVVQMFPGAIILIPYYVLMYQLGLIDQLTGLVIMYSVTALPFVLWFLKGFFDTIPVDLEEAAMVDGTTRPGALWRVIIPLATPAIAVAALFSFLSAWNEWLLAYTFMTSSANYTLPVGIQSFVNPPQVFWNEFAAISVLVSVPVAALFLIFQRYLVSGLTQGAVKG